MIKVLSHPELTLRYAILIVVFIGLTQAIPALLNGGTVSIITAVGLFILSIGYGIPYISKLIKITKEVNKQK